MSRMILIEASKPMRIPDEICVDDDYETAFIEEIRAHEVRDHKITSSPIPQIDGLDSLERVNETTGVIDNNVKASILEIVNRVRNI